MEKSYDKTRQISYLKGPVGVQFSLESDIEKAAFNRGLWGHSARFMSQVIHCILCDMMNEANALLIKSKTWMELAIETGEKARRFEEASNRFHRQLYSTIRWLHDGVQDQENLNIWCTEILQDFKKDKRVDPASLDLSAVTFVNAGAYESYIDLAATGSIDAIKCSGANEKQMALTLAAQALAQKFPEEKVQAVVKKFLDQRVGKWLNDGNAVRAAEWMKVIYWQRGQADISPFDAVRKCLEHVEHRYNLPP